MNQNIIRQKPLQGGRVYNFSAGPAMLPYEVLQEARQDLLNWKGCGMSVMEMSHRGQEFESILDQIDTDLRELLNVPSHYKILFLQGGASLQFSMVPMNFLYKQKPADYVITGIWGQKAFEAASLVGPVNKAYDSQSSHYNHTPNLQQLSFSANASYIHFTSNETIQGVAYHEDPDIPSTVVCDMSSDILSRPVDISKYDLIYASAQKNVGPAGVTIVILSEELIAQVPKGGHPMLDYRVHAENKSAYNTPTCWSIYVCGLVCQWLLRKGGLQEIHKHNIQKAKVLYDVIDNSNNFYRGHSEKASRSIMNVTFTLPSEELTKRFLKEAESESFCGLAGHRSVGGCRASIYNAFPLEGCQELAQFMRDFASRNS
jgi:phosphoserine aminotransferase